MKALVQDRTSRHVFTSIVALVSLAATQPTAELIGANVEFFIARRSPTADIIAFGFVLTIAIPLVVGLTALGLHHAQRILGRSYHAALFAILSTALGIRLVEAVWSSVEARWAIGIAVGFAVLLLVSFHRFESVRSFLVLASFAPLLAFGHWVFLAQVSDLVFAGGEGPGTEQVQVGNPAPVVFIVFDELPLASLIDGDGEILDELYPGFARLASDSIWFRNAISVEAWTHRSLPTLLSGNRADGPNVPALRSNYPDNLFVLLDDTFAIDANEPVTRLCPPWTCEQSATQTTGDTYSTLIRDAWVVSKHVVLPREYENHLPPIDNTFANFDPPLDSSGEPLDAGDRFWQEVRDDRGVQANRVIDMIRPDEDRPTFDFGHFLLPHMPWNFLPTGQGYDAPYRMAAKIEAGWTSDTWLVTQAYQQHLLQVQFTDQVVSDLIEQLETTGLYDEALIVVVADHGIGFEAGVERYRSLTEGTVGAMASVPLFIKVPGQAGGVIDDYRAETLDIAPTIADFLDIELPWDVEGTSLIAGSRPVRTASVINPGAVPMGVSGTEKLFEAEAKIDIFGTQSLFEIAPDGAHELLGTTLDSYDSSPADVQAVLDNTTALDNVHTKADRLPVHLRARLTGSDASGMRLVVVSLNGRIVAVTRTFRDEDDIRLQALVPASALLNGLNSLDLAIATSTDDGWGVSPIEIP